jgi:8-hydroxy-5-deazaflavin:NADPH oxidoreductase
MRITIIGPGSMGRGIATRLLAGGHSVTLVGRDRAGAEKLASELKATGGRSRAGSAPVSNQDGSFSYPMNDFWKA